MATRLPSLTLLLAATLMVAACGSTRVGDGPGETLSDGLEPSDNVLDEVSDASQIDSEPDLDAKPESTDYRLAGAPIPKDYNLFFEHRDMEGAGQFGFGKPSQKRLFALPFGMQLLSDGKTLRVAVMWFNGFAPQVYKDKILGLEYGSVRCYDPVSDVLPSGVVVFDVDTTNDTVKFVHETVLNLATAEYLRHNYATAMETFGALGPSGSNAKCWSMERGFQPCLEQFGSVVSVGGKEYVFPMCRFNWDIDEMGVPDNLFDCQGCARGCIEREIGSYKFDEKESGFLDPKTRLLHLLFARNPATGQETTIPLPMAGEQITRQEALISGCVEGANQEGQTPYDCGGAEPYYYLYRATDEEPFVAGCQCEEGRSGRGLAFDSLEEYRETSKELCTKPHPEIARRVIAAFFLPYYGAMGAFLFVNTCFVTVLDAEEPVGRMKPIRGAHEAQPGWNPSGNWFVDADTHAPPILPLGYMTAYQEGPNGVMERADFKSCFAWQSSLLEGSDIEYSFELAKEAGVDIFRVQMKHGTEMTLGQIKAEYGVGDAFDLRPPCSVTYLSSMPLHGMQGPVAEMKP